MGRTLLETYSNSADEEVMLRGIESGYNSCCNVVLFDLPRGSLFNGEMRHALQRSTTCYSVDASTVFPVVDRGLSKSVLQALPVVEFTVTDCPGAVDCAICLAEFDQSDKVRRLPNCHHCFHVSCIDTWFSSHSSCPTCRRRCSVHVDEKCPSIAPSACPSDATSAQGQPGSLQLIACPAHYWDGNVLEHAPDRYLP